MSRGPGSLQRRILSRLEGQPDHCLSRGHLRLLFPDTDRANLRRALRSLTRMGYVYERIEELELDPVTDDWESHWAVLVRPVPLGSEQPDTQDSPATPGGARARQHQGD